jgi:hypothetical protein
LESPSDVRSGRTRRTVLIGAGLIFAAIIVVSIGLALSTPPVLPQASTTQATQGQPSPYVVVEVFRLSSTTYTTTFTTTPQPQVYVVVIPYVIVVVNGSVTSTITTTSTTTSTSWQ